MRNALLACFAALPLWRASAADRCLDAPQIEMNACSFQRYKKADASLNATYRTLLSRSLETNVRGKLLAAQRAWVAFRDAQCNFEASGVEGGSVQPMIQNYCLQDVTQRRDKDLKAMLVCAEGDLACPVAAR